jgi:hypothetical protein
MSNTDQWQRRLDLHRYSQDDRALSYKYQRELEPIVNAFMDDVKQKTLILGSFDADKEPWRLLAINNFRKFGLKVIEKPVSSADQKTDDLSLEPVLSQTDTSQSNQTNTTNNTVDNLTEFSLCKLKLSKQLHG